MVQIIKNKCQYYNSHQHFPNIEGFCHFSLLLDLAKHVLIIICFICLRYVSCNVQLLNKHCHIWDLCIRYKVEKNILLSLVIIYFLTGFVNVFCCVYFYNVHVYVSYTNYIYGEMCIFYFINIKQIIKKIHPPQPNAVQIQCITQKNNSIKDNNMILYDDDNG